MYRPATSVAGGAATVIAGASGSGWPADGALALTVPHPAIRAMITDAVTGTIRKLRMFNVASREQRPGLWPCAEHSVSDPADNRSAE